MGTSFLKSLLNSAKGSPRAEKRNARRVLVSSNCQTGGLAAALEVLFPDDHVTPLPLPVLNNDAAERGFVEKLLHTDIWVSIGGHDLLEKHELTDRVQLIKIPIIRFSGFHPDLVYAKNVSTGEFVTPHYNSAIAIWSYKNGLDADAAENLFNADTFYELGYLSHWKPSIGQLKQRFDASDLDFKDFILPMRREGLFMYSLNHPKAIALARLAKLVALKMGAETDVMDKYVDINDGLNDVIWPVYPAVGDALSIPSRYEWKTGERQWIHGLNNYLTSAFEGYARQKLAPDDIIAVQIDDALYNQVLGKRVGIKS